MIGNERYADECASCRALIYVHATPGVLFSEHFCSSCRIANALEAMVELFEERFDSFA